MIKKDEIERSMMQSNSLRRIVSAIFWKLGYALIPRWRLNHYDFALHLRTLFTAEAIDCVIDVGANTGQYRDFLRLEVGYQGRIVSFEPLATNVVRLRQRAALDSKWSIMPVALGREDGEAPLNVTAVNLLSSLREPDPDIVDDYREWSKVENREVVQVRRLDGMFDEIVGRLGARRPYLKVDTQGTELDVIEGASGCIDRVRAMQLEVSIVPLYLGAPPYFETISTARRLGFEVTGIFEVGRVAQMRIVDLDCVMRRVDATNRR